MAKLTLGNHWALSIAYGSIAPMNGKVNKKLLLAAVTKVARVKGIKIIDSYKFTDGNLYNCLLVVNKLTVDCDGYEMGEDDGFDTMLALRKAFKRINIHAKLVTVTNDGLAWFDDRGASYQQRNLGVA